MLSRRLSIVLLLIACSVPIANGQSTPDDVTNAASSWLKAIHAGDRSQLNALMDPKFIATTPAGDVLTKERLVPEEADKPVQKLPLMELQSPMVRVFGNTAVLMSRLTSTGGPTANGTFVFEKAGSVWKLVALHMSPQK